MPFIVRVVKEGGQPVEDIRVVLSFQGTQRGQAAEFTGRDGQAEFDGHQPGGVIVFVDGRDCGTFQYADGAAITVTEQP